MDSEVHEKVNTANENSQPFSSEDESSSPIQITGIEQYTSPEPSDENIPLSQSTSLAYEEEEQKKFLDNLFEFHKNRKQPIERIPQIANQDLDFYKLYKDVTNRAGLENVIKNQQWNTIASALKLTSTDPQILNELQDNYIKYLYMYERKNIFDYNDPIEAQPLVKNIDDPSNVFIGITANNIASSPTQWELPTSGFTSPNSNSISLNPPTIDAPANENITSTSKIPANSNSINSTITNTATYHTKTVPSPIARTPSSVGLVGSTASNINISIGNAVLRNNIHVQDYSRAEPPQMTRRLRQSLQAKQLAPDADKKLVLALESGLKSEVLWALSCLTVLSFDQERNFLLKSVPRLLGSLCSMWEQWLEFVFGKPPHYIFNIEDNRKRKLQESEAQGNPAAKRQRINQKLFNIKNDSADDNELKAMHTSNIMRNFSFAIDNRETLAQNPAFMKIAIELLHLAPPYIASEDFRTDCVEEQELEEELKMNILETIANISAHINLAYYPQLLPLLIANFMQCDVPASLFTTSDIPSTVDAKVQYTDFVSRDVMVNICEIFARLAILEENEIILLSKIDDNFLTKLIRLLHEPLNDVDFLDAVLRMLHRLSDFGGTQIRIRLAKQKNCIKRLVGIIISTTDNKIRDLAAQSLAKLATTSHNKHYFVMVEHDLAYVAMSGTNVSEIVSNILYELGGSVS